MRFPHLTLLIAPLLLAACTSGTFTGSDGSQVHVSCNAVPTAVVTTVTSGTCSWTASPAPTTTAPPVAGFPTPATTGVPAGTVLTTHGGDVTITTTNQVISGWHVTGSLLVNAPGVQVLNSQVDGYLDNENTGQGSARMTVTDTTVGAATGCNDLPGVGEHDYTALRVLIRNHGDGFRISGPNVSVSDSFVQACDSVNNHDDGMQAYCPTVLCDNIAMNHNTLSVAKTQNYTAPLFGGVGSSNGQIAHASFTNNLLYGGVFSIYLGWSQGPSLTITGNRVATNPWTDSTGHVVNGWYYGSSSLNGTCGHVTWTDNRAVTIDSNWQLTADGGPLSCLN